MTFPTFKIEKNANQEAEWKCHFFEETPLLCFHSLCLCVCHCVLLKRQKSGYRLSFDFVSLPPGGQGRNAEPQQWLTLSVWKETGSLDLVAGGVGRGAGGVYLSHGNWFAGVEVGSFEKTSFSPTPSHLSVWKASGRKGRRMEGGREEGVLLQRHFLTKA